MVNDDEDDDSAFDMDVSKSVVMYILIRSCSYVNCEKPFSVGRYLGK